MMSKRSFSGVRVRRLAVAMLACAMLLRGLLPVGMMPDLPKLAGGTFELVICTGHGPQTVSDHDLPAIPASGQPAKSGGPNGAPTGPLDTGAGFCPFAFALSLFGTVLVVLLCGLIRSSDQALVFAEYRISFGSREHDPRTARGPPLAFCS